MRKLYSISTDVSLSFELDDEGNIIPNENETEFDATDKVQELCGMRGQKLDDFISLQKELPYGLKLCEIDLDEPNSQWELIQKNT